MEWTREVAGFTFSGASRLRPGRLEGFRLANGRFKVFVILTKLISCGNAFDGATRNLEAPENVN
ncbi:MAG: hypothetical protein AAGF23_20260, partial [Acidobacteriota bacterium]